MTNLSVLFSNADRNRSELLTRLGKDCQSSLGVDPENDPRLSVTTIESTCNIRDIIYGLHEIGRLNGLLRAHVNDALIVNMQTLMSAGDSLVHDERSAQPVPLTLLVIVQEVLNKIFPSYGGGVGYTSALKD